MLKTGAIGKIWSLHETAEGYFLQIKLFPIVNNFFSDPMPTSQLGIFKINLLQKFKTVVTNLS